MPNYSIFGSETGTVVGNTIPTEIGFLDTTHTLEFGVKWIIWYHSVGNGKSEEPHLLACP